MGTLAQPPTTEAAETAYVVTPPASARRPDPPRRQPNPTGAPVVPASLGSKRIVLISGNPERIAAARNHIEAVFGGAREGVATLWSKATGTMAFSLAEPGTKDAMARAAIGAAATGNIYYGVNLLGARPAGGGRGSADQVRLVTSLVADVDVDVDVKPGQANKPQTLAEALAFIRSLPLAPSRITRSGSGFHVSWILAAPYVIASDDDRAEIQSLSGRWSSYVLELAREQGYRLDNIGDLARVLRLEGTINRKHGGAADVVLVEESTVRYDLSDFLSLLPAVVEPPPPVARPTSNQPLRLDDAAVLARARAASNGAKFSALYDRGDLGGHGGDHSAADLALANHLVYWTDGDADQVDRLFRGSALFRDKWDEIHYADGRTHGRGTIVTALADRPMRISTSPPRPNPQDADILPGELRGDPQDADILPADVAGLTLLVLNLRRRVDAAEQRVAVAEQRATDAEHRADTALVRAREVIDFQRTTAKILSNRNLGQERVTAVALAQQLSTRKPDDNGRIRMPLMTLARAAGISEDAASAHVRKLEKHGVIKRSVEWIPETIDDVTGEIRGGHKALFVAPASNVTDFAAAVAQLKPEVVKNWGGARLHCPHHPDAEIEKTTTWSCVECGSILDTKTETIRGNPQDAVFLDDEADDIKISAIRPNPHLAVFLDDDDDELQPTGTDGPPFTGTTTTCGYTLRTRNRPTSHNVGVPEGRDTPGGAVAAAWLSGSSLRAPDESQPGGEEAF